MLTSALGEVSTNGAVWAHRDLPVVVAHDFMETYGGAERVTAEIARAFPEAPVVAILGRRSVARRMGVADRFHSLLPPRSRLLRNYRLLAPAFPAIVGQLRLPPAAVVVSSSYAFAHRLRSITDAPRVCYVHSPLRFAWSMEDEYQAEWSRGRLTGLAFRALAAGMRISDRRSAQSVDRYLAGGSHVARQLVKFYGREAEIVGAPVNCELFRPTDEPPGDYYVFCGRLIEPYKKIRLIVDAFNELGRPLVIAGDGPERKRLEAAAGPNISFVGHLDDQQLVGLMQRCTAAIFPSADDFGLTPLEVMACGRPVIAYRGGGAMETMKEGETGAFFASQTVEAVIDAVERFRPDDYSPQKLRQHALHWESVQFRRRITQATLRVAQASLPR